VLKVAVHIFWRRWNVSVAKLASCIKSYVFLKKDGMEVST